MIAFVGRKVNYPLGLNGGTRLVRQDSRVTNKKREKSKIGQCGLAIACKEKKRRKKKKKAPMLKGKVRNA